jgi:hypothetical protein
MSETESMLPLVRLGIVLAPALMGALLFTHLRQPVATTAPPAPESIPTVAPPDTVASINIATSNTAIVDADIIAASRMMIPPPPETEMALQGSDPRRLQVSFQRGMTTMESAADDEQKIVGARLINIAAILGYEPARALIARDYPKSRIIRTAVSAPEAIRYSLDPLFISEAASSETKGAFLAQLAAYFAGRKNSWLLPLMSLRHSETIVACKRTIVHKHCSRNCRVCTGLARPSPMPFPWRAL